MYTQRQEDRAVYIDEWDWDDGNLEELAPHGVTRRIVESVAEEAPLFRRNKRGRAASHQMIGPDPGGRMWTSGRSVSAKFLEHPDDGGQSRGGPPTTTKSHGTGGANDEQKI